MLLVQEADASGVAEEAGVTSAQHQPPQRREKTCVVILMTFQLKNRVTDIKWWEVWR